MSKEVEVRFHLGDTELLFLGLAAALTRRYEIRGKRARNKPRVSAGLNVNASELFGVGFRAASVIPADDVPEIHITVHMKEDALRRLEQMIAAQEE